MSLLSSPRIRQKKQEQVEGLTGVTFSSARTDRLREGARLPAHAPERARAAWGRGRGRVAKPCIDTKQFSFISDSTTMSLLCLPERMWAESSKQQLQ